MNNRLLLLIAPTLLGLMGMQLLADDPPAADDGEEPVTFEQLKEERVESARQDMEGLPLLGTYKLQEVIQFELVEGFLVLKTELPDTEDQSRIRIEGLPGITTVRIQRRPEEFGPDVPFMFHLIHRDFSSPDHLQIQSSVFYSPMSLIAARDEESVGEVLSIQLVQSLQIPPGLPGAEDPIRIHINGHDPETGKTTLTQRVDAQDFPELHRRHPREVAQYLQPLLRDLGQGHLFAVDSRVAWQVFPELYEPDDELKGQVEQLLPELDAANFQQREQASQALEQLGQPGALLLMSIDRRGLSAEQNARIEAFLEPYRPLEPQRAQELREDSSFLLDLLLNDERIFREAALRELRNIHPDADIEFDPDAEEGARAEQVQRLRKHLAPAAASEDADAAEPAGHLESLEGVKYDGVYPR